MGEPDRAMVVVVRRAGVAHTSQWSAGRANQRVEERSWIALSEVPAQALDSIDAEGSLGIGEWHDFTARQFEDHPSSRR
jgi:hypothetical protein